MRVGIKVENKIELVDYGRDSIYMDYAHMIQAFHRFLIDKIGSEGNMFSSNPSIVPSPLPAVAPISQLLGLNSKNIIMCTSCKAVREKEHNTHIVDLVYPRKVRKCSAYCLSRIPNHLTVYSFRSSTVRLSALIATVPWTLPLSYTRRSSGGTVTKPLVKNASNS